MREEAIGVLGRDKLSLLVVLIATLSFMTSCGRSKVTYLSCSGSSRTVGASSPEEPWAFSLTVDMERRTVTVSDYAPVPIFGDDSRDTIMFMASPPPDFGVSIVWLNRVTGTTSVHILEDGLRIIEGTCKPALKMF
jgi:hypothetical protein